MFIIRGVQMFSGPIPDWDEAGWGPLREVTFLCGLTLEGGVEEDLCGSPACAEPKKPRRDSSHLRLVSHA